MHGDYPNASIVNTFTFYGVFFGNQNAVRIDPLEELWGKATVIR